VEGDVAILEGGPEMLEGGPDGGPCEVGGPGGVAEMDVGPGGGPGGAPPSSLILFSYKFS